MRRFRTSLRGMRTVMIKSSISSGWARTLAPRGSNTYCNIFVWDATGHGRRGPHWVDQQGNPAQGPGAGSGRQRHQPLAQPALRLAGAGSAPRGAAARQRWRAGGRVLKNRAGSVTSGWCARVRSTAEVPPWLKLGHATSTTVTSPMGLGVAPLSTGSTTSGCRSPRG